MNRRPLLRYRRPSEKGEGRKRTEQVEGECHRSAERLRCLLATLIVGVVPIALLLLGGLVLLIPVAGPWLAAVCAILVLIALVGLLPAQFAVFSKACDSTLLKSGDRLLITGCCIFFSIGPVMTVAFLANRATHL